MQKVPLLQTQLMAELSIKILSPFFTLFYILPSLNVNKLQFNSIYINNYTIDISYEECPVLKKIL